MNWKRRYLWRGQWGATMTKRKRHNYREVIERQIRRGDLRVRPGTVTILDVYHDPECACWTGGACDCAPVVRRRELVKLGQTM